MTKLYPIYFSLYNTNVNYSSSLNAIIFYPIFSNIITFFKYCYNRLIIRYKKFLIASYCYSYIDAMAPFGVENKTISLFMYPYENYCLSSF